MQPLGSGSGSGAGETGGAGSGAAQAADKVQEAAVLACRQVTPAPAAHLVTVMGTLATSAWICTHRSERAEPPAMVMVAGQ
jgi:hypothetical protein